MIISCPNCKKNFEVRDNLIPEGGRLLQCSSCSNKWFFKNKFLTLKEKTKKKINIKTKNDPLFKNEIPNDIERIIIDAEKTDLDNNYELNRDTKKETDKISFFNLFLVILISFLALIIVFDTFKNPIDNILPGFNFMLNNFYETLKDLFLFSKDLIT